MTTFHFNSPYKYGASSTKSIILTSTIQQSKPPPSTLKFQVGFRTFRQTHQHEGKTRFFRSVSLYNFDFQVCKIEKLNEKSVYSRPSLSFPASWLPLLPVTCILTTELQLMPHRLNHFTFPLVTLLPHQPQSSCPHRSQLPPLSWSTMLKLHPSHLFPRVSEDSVEWVVWVDKVPVAEHMALPMATKWSRSIGATFIVNSDTNDLYFCKKKNEKND